MKLLLSIDDYVYFSNGRYYFDASTSKGMLERYLRIFEIIYLVARVKKLKKIYEGYIEINLYNGRISIVQIPFFRGYEIVLKILNISLMVRKTISNCDAALIRMPSLLGVIVICISTLKNFKYALEVVADPKIISNKPIKTKIGRVLEHFLKWACKNANGVSYVTKSHLQRLYPCSINAFTSSYSSIELNDSYYGQPKEFKDNGVFNIIHISFHITTSNKGQDIVIKTLKILRDSGLNVYSNFVGTGNYIENLKSLATELQVIKYVNFLGFKSKEEVRELLLKSDIMIFPSISEGMPRVILEACAVGLPCVASSVGGIPEILTSDVLFNPDDVIGFKNKTRQILTSKEYYEELSRQNFEMSRLFSKKYLEKKRDTFYKNLKICCQNT